MLNNLRNALRPALEKTGRVFASTGLPADFWTITGLAFAVLAGVVYGLGVEYALVIGGVLLLASGLFDVVDGQVARITKTTNKGQYLDSMSDKIAEVAVFMGILVGGHAHPYAVFLAITLSLLVSYARAKSDIISIRLQGIGIGERAERLLVIAIIGIAGFMEHAVVIVVIIAGITLVQRMVTTMRQIRD